MKYLLTGNDVTVENITDMDLKQTLDCGQSFRWQELDEGSFIGVAFGKVLHLNIEGNNLVLHDCSEQDFLNIWKPYFDLELDYTNIRNELSNIHPILNEAALYAPGIRILSQEPWEALCSFIISQNNNIPRIKGIISRLCSSFGTQLSENFFSFPSAKVLASLNEDDLSPIRSGFRAKYIIDAAKKVASGDINLEEIRNMSIDDAREELIKIKGVGAKVAECTLLYGLHRLDAFPLDVWMKRAMHNLFPGMTPTDFGKYAGIAQIYIFHYSRMHPELFE